MNSDAQGQEQAARLREALGRRSIVLVGMMGSGKSSVGRRLAARLGLPFSDADLEIEQAAGMTIPEIFAAHGEAFFRDGERRVIARLLGSGPRVLATGGGAFMSEETRQRIAEQGISVWLKAEPDVLMRRVRKRANRPLLQTPDPEGTLRHLLSVREPVYALADLTIESHDAPHEAVVGDLFIALAQYLGLSAPAGAPQLAHALVHVGLGARAYDILIGKHVIDEAGPRLAAMAPGAGCAIVCDANVAALHLQRLEESLDAHHIRHQAIIVPPGESTKCYAEFARVCDAIIEGKFERGDFVVALGGGVVGDLAGFCAASVRRGMRFMQIPTSLLAQVDSSVGGKTGINSPHGKNLVGAFYQPNLVLADVAILESLPVREFRAGYAEVVKYGLINDAPFFEWLEKHEAEIMTGGPARAEAIRVSCAAKAAIVMRDEREDGERALLNLGHTFAHAFERLTNYDGNRLVHGEAVAIGLVCAFNFSVKRGLATRQDAVRVERHLHKAGLPTHIADIPGWTAGPDAIIDAMLQDKKVSRGQLTFILARGIGQSFIAKGVEASDVREFLNEELAREAA